ncbi:tetratricopeptide repeat protein [uncultured Tenacibaculum sp.]|uniref:tetratricopeptide repeat protein n=1 Tax=uncultured Tenacibaculum sp. TaxID=174713 RepID=UPI00262BE0F8|nr:tetratricopeptide repeat protein [uncultured Tenacibaculum sp.]
MHSDNRAENLFFEADKLIEENRIVEAKEMLLELLSEFPDYGRAHNHLGWLYNMKFNNYPKAKNHLELAIKFAPDYHAAYSNYSYLLIDMYLNDEMITFGKKVIGRSVVDKSTIYNKMGQAYELKGDFVNAHKNYKLAIKETINNKAVDAIYASVSRVRKKMSLMQRIKLINQ